MEYTKKILYQSNYWYNDGLKKANIHDLSGAMVSLRRSLQYNRENIAARNLLGLVYYGRGEVAEGLVEWIISKNLKQHDNVANYFIKKVQETPSELEAVNQSIKKYNQCLVYCEQDGEDLAIIQLKKIVASHPNYLKAHQLLSLLYLKTEQYAKARQSLRKAHKIDTTNDITLHYMHELNQLKGQKVKEVKDATVTYNLGNETIIQPVSATLKDNASTITIVNIIIGILIGAAVVWFLIVPSVNESKLSANNKVIVEYSDQIAANKAEISALKKELETYRSSSDEAEATLANAATTATSYEALLTVSEHYNSSSYSNSTLAEELLTINPESLGTQGRSVYDTIAAEVFPSVCTKDFKAAKESYDVADYAGAIAKLEKIMQMDESFQEGQAMLLLGNAYTKNNETDKAAEKYNKVMEVFPGTDVATAAEKGLKGELEDNATNTPQEEE
ncbi:tetratricopeptide repeat protein [Lachnospiraceae bacterium LCP25S3_G4]